MAIEVVQGMGGGEGRDLICIHGGGETPLFFEFITVMEGWVGGGYNQPIMMPSELCTGAIAPGGY